MALFVATRMTHAALTAALGPASQSAILVSCRRSGRSAIGTPYRADTRATRPRSAGESIHVGALAIPLSRSVDTNLVLKCSREVQIVTSKDRSSFVFARVVPEGQRPFIGRGPASRWSSGVACKAFFFGSQPSRASTVSLFSMVRAEGPRGRLSQFLGCFRTPVTNPLSVAKS